MIAVILWLLSAVGFLLKLVVWYPLFTLSIGVYLVMHVLNNAVYKTQNLKKRYNAEWALVTGASSGIGKAITKKLAKQQLNVVLVALQDQLLDEAFEELGAEFPGVKFRKVGVNLGTTDFLPAVAEATSDIDVQLVFNNAGYMLTGFFQDRTLEQQMQNLECNAGSAVRLTHLFLQRMTAKKLRGCFVFTSSAAALIASPFTVLYAATKSFLSSFGAGLAVEVKHLGIDVLVFHPSPVNSRFYDKAHKLDALVFFQKFAVKPEELPDRVFAAIGRTVWRDIGLTAIIMRIMMKVLDYNFMAVLLANIAHLMPDFQEQLKASQAAKKRA